MRSAVPFSIPASTSTQIPARATALADLVADGSRQFLSWCVRCAARRRQRNALRALDDRLLTDIGLTRSEAQIEARKPFWQA